jgi:hypothetical protein
VHRLREKVVYHIKETHPRSARANAAGNTLTFTLIPPGKGTAFTIKVTLTLVEGGDYFQGMIIPTGTGANQLVHGHFMDQTLEVDTTSQRNQE